MDRLAEGGRRDERRELRALRFLRALESNLRAPLDEEKLFVLCLNELVRYLEGTAAGLYLWPGGVAAERRPALTRGPFPLDHTNLPRFGGYEGEARPRGFGATAFREGEEVVGEIVLHRADGDFPWSERELLRETGQILSRELGRRARERAARIEDRIQRKLLGELRPSDLFYQILDGLRSLVGFNVRASLLILDREKGELVIRADKMAWRRGRSAAVGRALGLSAPVLEFLAHRREPLLARRAGGGGWHGEEEGWPESLVPSILPLPEPGEPEPRCLVAAPLAVPEAFLGLLVAWGDDPYLFGRRELERLARLALPAMVAVQRARVAEQRELELEAIRSIGEESSRPTGRRELGEHILRRALDVMGVSTGSIELVDERTGRLTTLCELGHRPGPRPVIQLGQGIIGAVAAAGTPLLVDDVKRSPVYMEEVPTSRAELAVPLRYRDKTIGVLNVESSVPGRFGQDDLRFLSILAAQAAGALKASEFYDALAREIAEGRSRMRLLQRVGSLLGEIGETEALLESAARETRRWLRSQEAAIYLHRLGRLTRVARARTEKGPRADAAVARAAEELTLQAGQPPDHAPFGHVVRNNRIGRRPVAERKAQGHLLAVPLRTGERLLGVLRVVNKLDESGNLAPEGFVREDEDSLVSIASQAAVALSGHLRQRRLLLLHQVEGAFQETRDLDRACQRVVELVTGPLGGYRAASIRLANKFQELEIRGATLSPGGKHPTVSLARGEGVAWGVFQRGEATVIPQVREVEEYGSSAWLEEIGATSMLCLPLVASWGTVGTLAVYSAEEYQFPPDEREFLDTVAHYVALAVENLDLHANLKGLRQAGEALLLPGGLDVVLRSVLTEAAAATEADPVVLYLYEAEEDRFAVPPLTVGDVRERAALAEPVSDAHAARRLLAGGTSVFLEDLSGDPSEGFGAREGIASAARMLLQAGEEPLGVLFFNFRHSRIFTPRGKDLIHGFAAEASLAIRTARLVESRTHEIERLATYVRSAPVAIVETDAAGVVVFANEAAQGMLRARLGRPLGESDGDGRAGILRPSERLQMLEVARRDGLFGGEFTDLTRPGGPGYLYLSCSPLAPVREGEARYLVVGRDLTEIRQLQQSAALAELARGVAHDVNNSLGAVLPLAEAVREDLEQGRGDPQELVTDLREIERYVKACRRIFQGMMRASRERGLERVAVRVPDAIQATLELMNLRLAKQGIRVRTEIAPELPAVLASPSALERIFLNLVDNAAQAMPGGGTLTVRAERAHGGIAATVEDTGVGISPEDLSRVFEPFFTTKPGSTGLGLSSCRALVWEFGGKMELASEPEKGTTVRIWLPEEDSDANAPWRDR